MSQDIGPAMNFRAFQVAQSGHVLWFDPSLATAGVTVQQFLTAMESDSSSWVSAGP